MNQRSLLISVFSLFIFSLLALTTWASFERNVFDNAHLLKDRWFLATLMDAYWGFFTVYLWMAYKLNGWASRLLWLIAVVSLGNIAIGFFVIWQIIKWEPKMGLSSLILAERDQASIEPLPTA